MCAIDTVISASCAPAAPDPLRVVLADPDPLARGLVRTTLEAAGILVLCEAERSTETVDAVLRHRPDILVLDVKTLDDGLQVIQRVRFAGDVEVVVLTSRVDEELALAALGAGAAGYIAKDTALESLPSAPAGLRHGRGRRQPRVRPPRARSSAGDAWRKRGAAPDSQRAHSPTVAGARSARLRCFDR